MLKYTRVFPGKENPTVKLELTYFRKNMGTHTGGNRTNEKLNTCLHAYIVEVTVNGL